MHYVTTKKYATSLLDMSNVQRMKLKVTHVPAEEQAYAWQQVDQEPPT
jgi:hypothetical protein